MSVTRPRSLDGAAGAISTVLLLAGRAMPLLALAALGYIVPSPDVGHTTALSMVHRSPATSSAWHDGGSTSLIFPQSLLESSYTHMLPVTSLLAREGSIPARPISDKYKEILENNKSPDIDFNEYLVSDSPLEMAALRARQGLDAAAPLLKQGLEAATPMVKQGVNAASQQAQQALDAATPMVKQGLDAAAPIVRQGVDAAAPIVRQALDAAKPVVKQGVVAAAPVVKQGVDAAAPVVRQALDAAAPAVKQGVDATVNAAVDSGALPAFTKGIVAATPVIGQGVAIAAPVVAKGVASATCLVSSANDIKVLEDRVAELERSLRQCQRERQADERRAKAAAARVAGLEEKLQTMKMEIRDGSKK